MKQLILHNIKPEIILQDPESKKALKHYAVTKVLKGVAAKGWQAEKLFNTLDKDKSGIITCDEILEGCRTYLNVWLDSV